MLAGWGGVTWLQPLSARIYFPPVALYLLLLTVWLARQATTDHRPGPIDHQRTD